MFMDPAESLLLFSDKELKQINYFHYEAGYEVMSGNVFLTNARDPGWVGLRPKVPVGIVVDDGLGAPEWGPYLDCYGKGVCLGLTGVDFCPGDSVVSSYLSR